MNKSDSRVVMGFSRRLAAAFRIAVGLTCAIAFIAAIARPSSHRCKLLLGGPASNPSHECLGDGRDCESCSVEGVCTHTTTYIGDWQVCSCLCGSGEGSGSDCHASYQYNWATGQVVITCTKQCCTMLFCTDKTGNLWWDPGTDPCSCDLP
jgi:hypothetical protein